MGAIKILICEDDKNSLDALKNILARRDYQVAIAADGQETIEKTKELEPDLLLLDIRMPKINGIEAAKEIRQFNSKVKIIFLTAFRSPQISHEATKYNISGYIVKPSSPENIIATIKEALED